MVLQLVDDREKPANTVVVDWAARLQN